MDAINNALAGNISDHEEDSGGESWGGIKDDPEEEVLDHEEEYVDEDRYTTVTVEAVDVSRDGLQRVADDADESTEDVKVKYAEKPADVKKKWPKKERKQKFRYESKAERRVTRGKQKAGNKAKANARRGD